MIRAALLSLLLIASTSAACADEAPAPFDLRWIQLSDKVLPPHGVAERQGDAWVAHGNHDGAAYRFASSSRFIFVSGEMGLDWRSLQISHSWLVACHVSLPSKEQRCNIIRVVPVDAAKQKLGGLEFKRGEVCVVNEIETLKLEIQIDDATPRLFQGRNPYCLAGEKGEQFKRDLLAGKTVVIKGYFARPEPVVDITLSTYGLQQAIELRDWISDQYKAKHLQAAAPE